ncbi:mechanosensitive ion channel family protein (plasmid) [Paraburkholderia sp. PREW-6R]|uniref:mechanosensitive ion channel family protein n=1 Tax=Paraburkholderia sp. PREW-6R TaxID=3141544 RepID=UPI0031F4CA3D
MLVAITFAGVLGLRRFSDRIRLTFDVSCFIAISFYFHRQHVFFPVFPPLQAHADSGAVWLRAIGGAWWLLGSRIVVATLWFALHRDRRSRGARLFSDLAAAAIYIATAAIVLNSVFALPVTGVVATSGVVAIVLGLALQNTLADVFSGIAVGIEAPFSVGDRIQIADKIEGVVVQINWRSIRINTDGDDMAIIPNSLIAKAEIINRSIPSPRRIASVDISCSEHALPDRVIEILLHATLLCPDILQAPPPSAVLAQLGARRNTYKIAFNVANTSHLGPTRDLLLRSVRRQLHYAGFSDLSHHDQLTKSELPDEALLARRLLRDVILFECLDEQQLDGLSALLELLRLEPGDALFSEGSVDPALYIVAWGILELTRQSASATETIGCIGAGEYVGEIGMLTAAPHAATGVARTYCRIYRLPRKVLEPLLAKHSEFAAELDKSARRGMEALHRKVAVLASPDIGPTGQFLKRIRSLFNFGNA